MLATDQASTKLELMSPTTSNECTTNRLRSSLDSLFFSSHNNKKTSSMLNLHKESTAPPRSHKKPKLAHVDSLAGSMSLLTREVNQTAN